MDNQLENYYRGDIAWFNFASLFSNFPNTENTFILKDLMHDKDDLLLTKVIEAKTGSTALEWIYRCIPALDNLRPIDCIESPRLLKRLKTMLMRM